MNLFVVLQKQTQLTFVLLTGLKELLQLPVAGWKTSGRTLWLVFFPWESQILLLNYFWLRMKIMTPLRQSGSSEVIHQSKLFWLQWGILCVLWSVLEVLTSSLCSGRVNVAPDVPALVAGFTLTDESTAVEDSLGSNCFLFSFLTLQLSPLTYHIMIIIIVIIRSIGNQQILIYNWHTATVMLMNLKTVSPTCSIKKHF